MTLDAMFEVRHSKKEMLFLSVEAASRPAPGAIIEIPASSEALAVGEELIRLRSDRLLRLITRLSGALLGQRRP